MALSDIRDRQNVLDAIAECDALGRKKFLETYGFSSARGYWIEFNGKTYDSKAILGVAHRFARPDLGPLSARSFSGGELTVERKLNELGFEVQQAVAASDFLLTWKQSGWPHADLLKLVRKYERDGVVREPWRFKAVRMAKPGARVWLLKQGDGPKGIFGLGQIVGAAFRGDGGTGDERMMVPVEFSKLTDPLETFLIDEAQTRAILSDVQMRTQSSGISISQIQARAFDRALSGVHLSPDVGDSAPFDPSGIVDARERIERTIAQRRGQQAFRDALLRAYQGRCAISGCDVVDVLEAAHIFPYLGPDTNRISNGLLLRADIHTLYDCGLVAIDPSTKKVLVNAKLNGTYYEQLRSRSLRMPRALQDAPSTQALAHHKERSGF